MREFLIRNSLSLGGTTSIAGAEFAIDKERNKDANKSTISLLDHLNFNVPNHDYILEFYLDILGCGLDPRVACNLMPENDEQFGRTGLIWASCGPNQFHFPRDKVAQYIPGRIGLRYKSLDGLAKRLKKASEEVENNKKKCFESYEIVKDPANNIELIKIRDRYGNNFHCRVGPEKLTQYRQQSVKLSDEDKYNNVAIRFGIKEETDCRGIDYADFDCKIGTAERIAKFYDIILGATTSVVREEGGRVVAYILLGDINKETGEATQYLAFRETSSAIPEYNGHHVALYVGEEKADFEVAYKEAEKAGLLSTNWRDKVDVLTLEDARSQNQFRINKILDMRTGETIFELEHEMRSVEHPTWPGK